MSVFETAIGWLAPPECLVCGLEGAALCSNCITSGIKPFGQRCWRCNSLSPLSQTCAKCRAFGPLKFVWISTNYSGPTQQLIRKYKFGHLRAASTVLADVMAKTLLQTVDVNLIIKKQYLILPVPTTTSRIRERGFGHSELLAKSVAHKIHAQYSNNLRRLDQTRQLGSKREDRLMQLNNSFGIKQRRQIKGRNILLIDDVLTTGGTLISAAKFLKQAGAAQVSALVFAKRL
jgi:ComF family protein